VKGESMVNDVSSVFYGPHKYDTKFLMLGLFGRLKTQYKIFQPYVSLGTGGSMWFPGENDDRESLPMKKKISWSTSPFAGIGTGIAIQIRQNWIIDIGAKGFYFFSDELDNVDGRYVTGKSGMNDYTVQAGITLVYLLGGDTGQRREIIPQIVEPFPERIPPPEITVEETPEVEEVPEEETDDVITQEPVPAPEQPETVTEPEEKVEESIPDETISAPAPVIPLPQPVMTEEPETIETSPRPSDQQRSVRRTFLVHVESFPTIDTANDRAATLREMGYQTQVQSVDRGEIGIWFRVYVGPYSSRSAAERAAERLIELGLSDYAAVIESEE
jgi:cell division septation protein DedD